MTKIATYVVLQLVLPGIAGAILGQLLGRGLRPSDRTEGGAGPIVERRATVTVVRHFHRPDTRQATGEPGADYYPLLGVGLVVLLAAGWLADNRATVRTVGAAVVIGGMALLFSLIVYLLRQEGVAPPWARASLGLWLVLLCTLRYAVSRVVGPDRVDALAFVQVVGLVFMVGAVLVMALAAVGLVAALNVGCGARGQRLWLWLFEHTPQGFALANALLVLMTLAALAFVTDRVPHPRTRVTPAVTTSTSVVAP